MALSRIATVLAGLLLSRGGRRLAGRHAGKLALLTLAWELYQQHRGSGDTATRTGKDRQPSHPADGGAHPRRRWSGRRN